MFVRDNIELVWSSRFGHDLRSRKPSWTDTEGIAGSFVMEPEDTGLTASLGVRITSALVLDMMRRLFLKTGSYR